MRVVMWKHMLVLVRRRFFYFLVGSVAFGLPTLAVTRRSNLAMHQT